MPTDIDKGWTALGKSLKGLDGDPHVLCGIQGQQAAANDGSGKKTVAEIASYNEFGTKRIPARSFIRATIDLHEAALLKLASQLGQGVMLGKFAPGQALELLGEKAVGDMVERINAGIEPANAPSTIAAKGSSKPLVNRGQLKNSLTYKVAV